MVTHIFVQARVKSTRLPGKILEKIYDKSILELITLRLKKVKDVDDIIVVTGTMKENMPLIEECNRLALRYFCGSEENILDRIYKASLAFNSGVIIRVTGDCPLIDATLINEGVEIFYKNEYDILSNHRDRTFPDGLDFEIFRKNALKRAWVDKMLEYNNNEKKFSEVFVNPIQYMLDSTKFKKYDLINNHGNLSSLRLTLDYPEDLELTKKIYEALFQQNKCFGLNDILELMQKNPQIRQINEKYAIDYRKTDS